jgi:hypothetical protein
MANNLPQALRGIDELRGACMGVRDEAAAFRDRVIERTGSLSAVVNRLAAIRITIAENVVVLRGRLAAVEAAAAAGADGDVNAAQVAAQINAILDGVNLDLDGLDDAGDALAREVARGDAEVTGLENDNPALRHGGGGGGGAAAAAPAAGQGGGRRRRRRRGGHTPNRCKKCCGKGTKHVKHGRCVSRRTKRRRRRRRRR